MLCNCANCSFRNGRRERQDRQCTYYRDIEEQWQSNEYYIFWVCACSLGYPTCNAHAPYCYLWPVWLYYILSIMPFFRDKKATEPKICVLIFSTTFVLNISYSKKKWARYDQKTWIGLHIKYPLFLSYFNDTWIFSTDFRKISICRISITSVPWEPSRPMQTDRQAHGEANSRFLQIFAYVFPPPHKRKPG
jgi:hypothetical protein